MAWDAGHYRNGSLNCLAVFACDGLGRSSVSSVQDDIDGLEPGLLNAIWLEESGGGKNMLSKKGAQGHFQFMPETAKQYGLKDPNNLEESATAAGKFLSDLSKKYGGDRHKMLAGYN